MSTDTTDRQMVLVNKAILYAALINAGGYALVNWPPNHWEPHMTQATVEYSWLFIFVVTLAVVIFAGYRVIRLEWPAFKSRVGTVLARFR